MVPFKTDIRPKPHCPTDVQQIPNGDATATITTSRAAHVIVTAPNAQTITATLADALDVTIRGNSALTVTITAISATSITGMGHFWKCVGCGPNPITWIVAELCFITGIPLPPTWSTSLLAKH